jgi:hypothetical protein
MSNHLEPCGADGSTGRKWTLCADVTETRRMALRAPLAGGAGLFLETATHLTFTVPLYRFPSPGQWAQCMA